MTMTSATRRFAISGPTAFAVAWFGQVVSFIGSGLTSFALGVCVYQATESITQYALISLFFTLPGVVFGPLVGALVDRWDRRWGMLLSDAGTGLSSLAANRQVIWVQVLIDRYRQKIVQKRVVTTAKTACRFMRLVPAQLVRPALEELASHIDGQALAASIENHFDIRELVPPSDREGLAQETDPATR